jgi:Holliday junction DNA helicase RuvA
LAHTLQAGDPVFLHIYHHIREDAQQLYGFTDPQERAWFELLLGVSGIGPRVALQIVSAARFSDFLTAVMQEDLARLSDLPGVGKKTAQRLIVELKDKLRTQLGAEPPVQRRSEESGTRTQVAQDVIEALTTLGYNEKQASAVYFDVLQAHGEQPVEQMLRLCLQRLARS